MNDEVFTLVVFRVNSALKDYKNGVTCSCGMIFGGLVLPLLKIVVLLVLQIGLDKNYYQASDASLLFWFSNMLIYKGVDNLFLRHFSNDRILVHIQLAELAFSFDEYINNQTFLIPPV